MIDIKMPQLGESVTEGTVGRWLKQPGDAVAKYEPLLEVVTDKVDTEVPAPEAGILHEILVPEGETVRVGTVIARLAPAGAAVAAPAPAASPVVATVAAPAVVAAAATTTTAAPPATPPATDGRNAYLSPVVARLLAEHNLDPAQIRGSGQGGRITKQDVLRFLAERERQPAAPTPAVAPAPVAAAPVPTPVAAVAPASAVASAPASAVEPAPAPVEIPADAELIPLTPMRRSIAEHMTRSVRTAPHATTVMEVDLSRVLAHRAAHQEAFNRQGVRLTLTPYFVMATVAGLQAVPVFNGSFTEQGIVLHRRINIGIAVALNEGLLVPVIPDADEKNLLGLARAVNDLAERARTKRLRPEETHGGTFTITNHGVTGSLFATPIINQPQAGILGIGAVVKRPVVITQNGLDAIAIRPLCYLSFTFDHRIADGATADRFLATVKQRLEQWEG
ncbi:dihydrolipoamide acetyltransferase family protein [uncultured Chloroflexus sp.]|uniref:dihydrolipoamide acetyltransferase family protein n=1 Tax=uncultured Chloroflexus sp. TaxID=214040 RepID=UPI002629EDD7|nr:dihydrolipoamide acetyltransferase family protein [uncultured Chloroflexus sp.]